MKRKYAYCVVLVVVGIVIAVASSCFGNNIVGSIFFYPHWMGGEGKRPE